MWRREDLAWVAGIIEGEGYFLLVQDRCGRWYPKVRVQMNDRDVLERMQAITGFGRIVESNPPSRPQSSPIIRWNVERQHEAYALMVAIYPWMCVRRALRIREVCSGWINQPSIRKRAA